jgi:hypothetical protein
VGLVAAIGFALVYAQSTERAMGKTMHLIFGAGSLLSVEEIDRLDKDARAKTFGQLIAALRKEVDLASPFEALFGQFLGDRNVLVHRLDQEEGFDFNTAEGRKAVHQLAARIVQNGEILTRVFLSFSFAFMRRIGLECPPVPDYGHFKQALADANHVWALVSGPKQARVIPPGYNTDEH